LHLEHEVEVRFTVTGVVQDDETQGGRCHEVNMHIRLAAASTRRWTKTPRGRGG
jgi:hypothetical protein